MQALISRKRFIQSAIVASVAMFVGTPSALAQNPQHIHRRQCAEPDPGMGQNAPRATRSSIRRSASKIAMALPWSPICICRRAGARSACPLWSSVAPLAR